MKMTDRVAFWNAVNEYMLACGGDGGRISTRREKAVVAVEEALRVLSTPAPLHPAIVAVLEAVWKAHMEGGKGLAFHAAAQSWVRAGRPGLVSVEEPPKEQTVPLAAEREERRRNYVSPQIIDLGAALKRPVESARTIPDPPAREGEPPSAGMTQAERDRLIHKGGLMAEEGLEMAEYAIAQALACLRRNWITTAIGVLEEWRRPDRVAPLPDPPAPPEAAKEEAPAYDPKFPMGDGARCACGHTYYRHYDTYDDMAPIGCKYCDCRAWRHPDHPPAPSRAPSEPGPLAADLASALRRFDALCKAVGHLSLDVAIAHDTRALVREALRVARGGR